jgi:uncharacterized protein involved in type VI secretion and phage assembly
VKDIKGVVIGIVQEIDAAAGAVKVDFPWMSPPQRSHWAPIATLMSGRARGVYSMPEKDDEVLVAFEHGQFDHPYVVGFLWNGVDEPPDTDGKHRVIKTPGRQELRFEDNDGAKKVVLRSDAGFTVEMDEPAQTLSLRTPGQLSATLSDADGSIELKGGGRTIAMRAGQVQIT